MNNEQSRQDFCTVYNDFRVIFGQKVQKPLQEFSFGTEEMVVATLTLLVTVLANLRMLAVLPFSQRRSVYISRTLVPICLFVRVVEGTSFPLNIGVIVGRLGPFDVIVPDRGRGVPYCVLGVRDVLLAG